jgi:hypothetical protein
MVIADGGGDGGRAQGDDVVVLETPARVEMAGNGDRKNGDLRCFVTS